MSQASSSHAAIAAEVSGRWDALFDASARSALERALPAYVSARRWYRTKTKRVQAARVLAAFPLPFGDDVGRITLVELSLDDGGRETYVIPLAFVGGEEATRLRTRRPHAIVQPLRVTGGADAKKRRAGEGFVVDALALEDFLGELLGAITRGITLEDGGFQLRFHALPAAAEGAKDQLRAKLVDREQTNTSVLFGEKFVGKVVRKIDAGESPDLEVGRFLTAAGYTHTPALAGWIDVRSGDGTDAPSTVGLLHAFVANQGDAWEHVLGVLERWLGAAAHRDSAPPKLPSGDLLARASAAPSADVTKAVGEYGQLATLLGMRVGEMHVALASRTDDAAFAPEPLDSAARGAIAEAVRTDLNRALTALGARAADLPSSARTALAEVRGKLRGLEGRLGNVARQADGGVKIRVHGDLHLGQVLFTGSDFMLIDFEGEPARPLAERKAKRSPLVDVAGMLRSFHYAAVSALRASPEGSRAALAPWSAFWHRAVSAAFLRGWLDAVKGSVVLPNDPAVTRALLDLYLLEKGVYEVGYEMNNRPEWVEIPLEGLRELMESEPKIAADGNGRAAATVDKRFEEAPASPAPATLPSGGLPAVESSTRAPAVSFVGAGGPGVEPAAIDPHSPAVQAFLTGKATHAHRLLGSRVTPDGAVDFAVWAPNATRVAVVGDFNGWAGEATPLAPIAGTGIFAARVRGAKAGHRYKYRITTKDGGSVDKADPFAATSEVAPGNASVIAALDYAWADDAWINTRADHARLDRPMSIYEVHLGSWRRVVEEGNRPLSYREIAAPLAAHAKQMGFTHVELMPVLEHPFYGSWGYGVTGFFAATSRYGSPQDLMFLVDTLHQAGLGVILDWVPAHFARDPHGLSAFDGTPTFEPADASRAIHPTWNTGLFDYARPEVRSFLLSSAMYWIETFHADGLRVDGVESMLYRDHGRAPGTWTPNEQGGRENLEGVAFLRELTSTLKLEHPEVLLAAEDSSAWPGVTRAASAGGLGFDLKWDMGFSHDLRRYLSTDPIHRSQHQGMLTFRSVYAANEGYVLPLSHDEVVEERGGSLLQQMHGDAWQRLANLRLLYATMFAQTGKKLFFMGNEWAQPHPWHHDRSLDWHVLHEPAHDGIARMVGDLNRLYRETPALHVGDAAPHGFEWIDGSNAAQSVIAFLRRASGGDDDVVLVVCNFTPVPRHQYRIGVPRGGRWREIFNSDARDYGGSGHGNMGGVEAVPYPWNGRNQSIVVTLPPLGIMFLAR